MGRKILHYRNLRYPLRRWLALALLTALVVVQLSPLGAAATGPQRSAMPPTAPLLSQLEALPGGAIALPNFDPAVNGFQFSNQELIDAIDLERNAAAWEEVLSEQLMQLFGSQVCVGGESATCVLTSAAQRWLRTQLSRMDQGLSEGMAAAALDLWQPTPPRLPWWQRLVNVLLGRTVFGLARTLFDLQTFIANLFLMQGVTEVSQPTQAVRDTFTPTQILLAIARVFLTGSGDPFTLGVYRLLEGAVGEGHSLTPYRVEDRGRGQYWVYVYDSNYPAGRPTSPTDLHVEFDTQADTWRYQPIANGPEFKGDAQSKTLDLTQKSWRQPPPAPQSQSAPQTQPATTGPFTCPFCRAEPEGGPQGEPVAGITPAPAPTLDITLVGEGQLTVRPYSSAVDPGAAGPASLGPASLGSASPASDRGRPSPVAPGALVPFKGGLNRAVPASYRLPIESWSQPLAVTLTGGATLPAAPATLQLTGPGYTATVAGLSLAPRQTLTLYLVPNPTGPEITFVASRAAAIPRLAIDLDADTRTYQFDSSTPATGFSLTTRQVSKSSGFELSGLKLPAGQRVALTANTALKRLTFADDDPARSQYALTVKHRLVIKDRIQLGESQPDIVNYSLAYDEDLRAEGVQVEAATQAVFDYDPAFIDPAELPRQALLDAVEQRDFPIAIAYEPLVVSGAGPLRLVPSGQAPVGRQVFGGVLRKAEKGG